MSLNIYKGVVKGGDSFELKPAKKSLVDLLLTNKGRKKPIVIAGIRIIEFGSKEWRERLISTSANFNRNRVISPDELVQNLLDRLSGSLVEYTFQGAVSHFYSGMLSGEELEHCFGRLICDYESQMIATIDKDTRTVLVWGWPDSSYLQAEDGTPFGPMDGLRPKDADKIFYSCEGSFDAAVSELEEAGFNIEYNLQQGWFPSIMHRE